MEVEKAKRAKKQLTEEEIFRDVVRLIKPYFDRVFTSKLLHKSLSGLSIGMENGYYRITISGCERSIVNEGWIEDVNNFNDFIYRLTTFRDAFDRALCHILSESNKLEINTIKKIAKNGKYARN